MSIKFFNKIAFLIILLLVVGVNESCVTKKRKKEVSKLSKFYHNVTSEYNGYFNANELMEFAIIDLQAANVDNYTTILELYDYISVPDPNMVKPDMDIAIEKVTRVAALHQPGDWVDDCYVLMGKAQYLKQDYDTAIETFEYFQEDFNPANPYGRNFQKKKISSKAANKQKKKERAEAKKIKETERKKKEDARKDEKKIREKEKKARSRASKKRGSKKRPVRTPKPSTEDSTTLNTNKVITTVDNNNSNNQDQTKVNKPSQSKVTDPVDKSSYNEGLVWLARSMVRAGKYTSAEFLLNRLEKKPSLDKDIVKEISIAHADILIKTGKETDALPYLDQGIASKSANRSEKGRYAFIAGQILMKEGRYGEAASYFKTAKKKSKDYKMKFMSELNSIKCRQLDEGSDKNVVGRLENMLKETKYVEFKDEIYFALGEIAANNNDIAKAKEYFGKSVASSKGKSNLKTEAYYKLAQITYTLENYVDSKAYYDSTSMVINKTDTRRAEVQKMSINLKDISLNIQKIERLDSVIAMASMSKDELMKIAKNRLEIEKASGKKTDTKVGQQTLFVKTPRATVVQSDFWAYNIVAKENGRKTFISTWGDRPLVDNWRLQSKIDVLPVFETQKEDIQIAEKEENNEIGQEEYDRLMADVPSSALAKGKLEDEVRAALFELGKLFRDRLQNYNKSAITLEELNRRFSNHNDLLDAFYYLYLDYQDLNKVEQANKYKALILTDYADSKYANLISNPSFAATLEDERKKIDKYYDQTYAFFQKGEYTKVSERVEVANSNFGKENKLIAKFALLNAMAMGNTDGEKAYIKGLNEVVLRYPNTPEELKAKEILRFIQGDKSAFSDIDIKEVDDLFNEDENSRHYIAVILFDYSDDILQNAKISISDYNKLFHAKDRLQMGEMLLNKTENTQLILVRSFPNKAKAMEYYKDVKKNKDKYITPSLVNYELLPITQQNYRKMLQQKTHSKYKSFFDRYYILD